MNLTKMYKKQKIQESYRDIIEQYRVLTNTLTKQCDELGYQKRIRILAEENGQLRDLLDTKEKVIVSQSKLIEDQKNNTQRCHVMKLLKAILNGILYGVIGGILGSLLTYFILK